MATTTTCSVIGLRYSANSSNAKKELVYNNKAGEALKQSLFYSSCNKRIILNNKRRLFSLMLGNAIPGGRVIEEDHTALETILRGRFVEDRFVYRQTFAIRSYEIGLDKTVTIETLVNFLQETGKNHVRSCGITSGNEYSATRETSLRKLIWVVKRIQVQVLRHSKWGDEVEVDAWFDAAGKNGMRRDWIIRDHNTKEIIARATSTWVLMNKETRRLSKIPKEVRQEVAPFSFNRVAIVSEETNCRKVDKLTDDPAERIRSGMSPGWSDIDANQHVNNVKYIGWILASVPKEVLEDYKITSITIEFRRECTYSNLFESMTSPTERVIGASNLQYTHLLRLQDDKSELVRAKTEWHLNQKKQ